MTSWWLEVGRGCLQGLCSSGLAPGGTRVLCYHGLVEARSDVRLERNLHSVDAFRQHIRLLRRLRVVALPEVLQELTGAKCARRPAIAVTFDDGYANNLMAAEILSEHHIPWTLFVSTGAVGSRGAIWTVELSLLLLHGRADHVELWDQAYKLGSREDREATFQAIRYPLKRLPAPDRHAALDCIREQFPEGETERLLQQFPSLQMLGWDGVRQLAAAGVEVGSHGVDHEIHHASQPEPVRWRELTQSKADLEAKLGVSARFFAFPNGDSTGASAEEVRAAGYELGFTLQPSAVTPGSNACLLPRLTPPASLRRLAQLIWSADPAKLG